MKTYKVTVECSNCKTITKDIEISTGILVSETICPNCETKCIRTIKLEEEEDKDES